MNIKPLSIQIPWQYPIEVRKIDDNYKDFQVAQDMFGMTEFRANQKSCCELVKKLRKCEILLMEASLDGVAIIDVVSENPKLDGLYFIDEKYLTEC